MSLFELAFSESWAGRKEAAASLRDTHEKPVHYSFSFEVARHDKLLISLKKACKNL